MSTTGSVSLDAASADRVATELRGLGRWVAERGAAGAEPGAGVSPAAKDALGRLQVAASRLAGAAATRSQQLAEHTSSSVRQVTQADRWV